MRLEVTRKSDLGICALVVLAAEGVRIKTADLAERLDAAPAFMSQVLMELVRNEWVASSPGPTGGYQLLVDPRELAVLDVVEAIEGPTDNMRCVVANSGCGENGYCALHDAWSEARGVLVAHLQATTIADIGLNRAREWADGGMSVPVGTGDGDRRWGNPTAISDPGGPRT